MTRPWLAVGLLAAVAAVVAVGVFALVAGPGRKHLAADFPNTINLYPGAEVKVLGVTIGSVDSVAVRGTRVHVEMSYDGERTLPANVQAAIVPPSIVGDRYVAMTPAYTGGPVLADKVQLPDTDTQVPVELDDAYKTINHLAQTLGPQGANSTGALSRLISSSATALHGNGDALHTTIQQLSGAVSTVADSSPDIAGTVTNLGALTATLSGDDGQVRTLLNNLATVSDELNGQRDQLGDATRNLDSALDDISHFVRDTRPGLAANISGLADVTRTVAGRQRELSEVLEVAPVGVENLYDLLMPVNYDPAHPEKVAPQARMTAIVARFGGLVPNLPTQLAHLFTGVCSQLPVNQQTTLAPACTPLQQVGGAAGQLAAKAANPLLGPGLDSSPAPGLPTLPLGGGR